MTKVEIQFREILPREKYAVSMLYRVRVDGEELAGGVRVDLVDTFLQKYRAMPIPNVQPPKFGGANQALLPEIGRLCVVKVLRDIDPEELARRCKEGAAKPLVVINHETFGDIANIDGVLEMIKKEAGK